MKILINFAARNHFGSQKRNSESGKNIGGFDRVIEYGAEDIDNEFAIKNHEILKHREGAGFWLWKPYIILKTLKETKKGDFIFYSDAGAEFISSVDPLIEICRKDSKGIILFQNDPVPGNEEKFSCKRDVFVIMHAEEPEYTDTVPIIACFQLYRTSSLTIAFAEKYLEYCSFEQLIMGTPNVYGKNNYPGFKGHRHDQSILSILSKQWDVVPHRDPTQFGNKYLKPEDGYNQIINHTRTWD